MFKFDSTDDVARPENNDDTLVRSSGIARLSVAFKEARKALKSS
jgi:hypothetical protein